jgi:hypothetical protein
VTVHKFRSLGRQLASCTCNCSRDSKPSDLQALYWYRREAAWVIAMALAAPLMLAGCATSQPSVRQLQKIAGAIPLPAGLTLVNDVDHLQRPGDFGTQSQY